MDSSTDSSASGSEEETQEFEKGDAISNLNHLPEKSREKYLKSYKYFMHWRSSKGYKSFSENVFLAYFKELAKTKKASTLWASYSMIRSTLNALRGVEINTYRRLRSFLKIQSQTHVTRKSKMFSAQDIETFLENAPDEIYLAVKVALIFSMYGACRVFELTNLRVNDIQKHSDQIMLVNIMKTPKEVDRSFIVRDKYIKLVEKYEAVRPPRLDRFFVCYQDGKCKRQYIGRNTISSYPMKIASFLNLPNPHMYSGHCLTRVAALGLVPSTATTLRQSQRWQWNTEMVEDVTQSIQTINPSIINSMRLRSADSTKQCETPVNETQLANIQQSSSLDDIQIKTEWIECPHDESPSVKSDDQFDHTSEECAMPPSPLPRSPPAARRALSPRVAIALERRRLKLDEVRARQLHAREMRRLRVQARRVEVDRERNVVLRRIADVAFALLEKTMGNGGVILRP